MPFEKGHTKIGGRGKGKVNRNTKKLRILLRELLEIELENIGCYLDEIENPKEKLELIIKLMPFVFPKISSSTLEDVDDNSNGSSFLDMF